jgi:hypothetical protein
VSFTALLAIWILVMLGAGVLVAVLLVRAFPEVFRRGQKVRPEQKPEDR